VAVTKGAAAFSSYRSFVIGSCHDLGNVENSFRTSKTGVQGARLPPQARLDQRPPHDYVRRPGGQQVD
jgi:hypothetical protein